ncbi:uncharacterized protein [Spinacia oleracea]|uniref:Endonuclease/exonuclease/phosphatase domain-containing protein n=1 Tax=Spinacia oleracea TaxID=3562 RepID=A0A9R0I9F0_SPIOL|nr:uncharacterized protein LOC110784800 [Spinacia oleracea]
MKMVAWNCRGLNDTSSPTFPFLKWMVSSCNVDLLFLSETKCSVEYLKPFSVSWGFSDCNGVDATNSSGGLFVCWHSRLNVSILFLDDNYVLCNVLNEVISSFYALFVYGSPYLVDRESVWASLRALIWAHPGNIVTMGDFNQLEGPSQKLGGNPCILGSRTFLNWKIDCSLLDIPSHGATFTWTNNRDNGAAIYEKLDRGYCNSAWRTSFPNAVMWNFPILLSDHGPILLDCNPNPNKRRRPYRFEAWCLDFPQPRTIVQKAWETQVNGSGMYQLQRRIRTSLKNCKKWCLDFKLDTQIDWHHIHEELLVSQDGIASMGRVNEEKVHRKKVEEVMLSKLSYWKQRSRSKWDCLGDQGTAFFYRAAQSRKCRNDIKMLQNEDGDWLSSDADIKGEFVKFYRQLFAFHDPPATHEATLLNWQPHINRLSPSHVLLLTNPFSVQEIEDAMFSMEGHKSPGPDGVPPSFFHKQWEVTKPTVLEVVQGFSREVIC